MVGLSDPSISLRVSCTVCTWSSKLGWLISTTCTNTSASRTSSNVDLKDSTSWWGSLRINPTVSDNKNGKFSITTLRTVVSSVANNLFSANTSDLLNVFIIVLLPTLVYPTSATRTICPRFLRWVAICLSMACSFFFKTVIWLRIIRLSVSISFSPAPPRVPVPPRWRSKWVHMRVKRGSKYWYLANSTCVLACAVRALLWKISRISKLLS